MVRQNLSNNDPGRATYFRVFMVAMGLGLLAIIFFIAISARDVSGEYPELAEDIAINDVVSEVEIKRGSAYVVFQSRKKYHVGWAQSFHYQNFFNLSDLIETGDTIIKKKYNDTITVSHDGKYYVYKLQHVIR
jgi:hypothetical protein